MSERIKSRVSARLPRIQSGLLLFTVLFAGTFGGAAQPLRAPSKAEIIAARELGFQGDYDGAASRFAEMARKYPESPAGEFYQAVTLIWKSYVDAVSLASGTRTFDTEMEPLLEAVVAKAEAQRTRADKSKQDEVEALYFLGSAGRRAGPREFFSEPGDPAAKFGERRKTTLTSY